MKTVNVHEAKTHLSRLLAEVEAGEEIIIARAGTPVARVVSAVPVDTPRRLLGPLRGHFVMPDDFDHWAQDEILALFEVSEPRSNDDAEQAVKYLLDTNILVWTLGFPDRLPADVVQILADPEPEIWFSAVNIWEIGIKSALGRAAFTLNPHVARAATLQLGFIELAIDGAQAATASDLPPIHSDPFDRLLVAQAILTGSTLLTSDATVAEYQGPIRHV